jgi:hypothetical protein
VVVNTIRLVARAIRVVANTIRLAAKAIRVVANTMRLVAKAIRVVANTIRLVAKAITKVQEIFFCLYCSYNRLFKRLLLFLRRLFQGMQPNLNRMELKGREKKKKGGRQ